MQKRIVEDTKFRKWTQVFGNETEEKMTKKAFLFRSQKCNFMRPCLRFISMAVNAAYQLNPIVFVLIKCTLFQREKTKKSKTGISA